MKLVKLGILFFTLIGFANTSVFSTSFCLNKQENQTSYHLDISCNDKSEKNDNSIIINFRKAFTSSSIPPNPDEVETTQIPDSNIEIAADPEEHEEDKEDLAMVAESKLYKMVLKDLFEYLNR